MKVSRNKPVFLLGVGAQRSGTTWLHHYLKSQSLVDMGFAKELHAFGPDFPYSTLGKHLHNARRSLKLLKYRKHGRQLFLFRVAPRTYWRHFANLVDRNQELLLTGEITPKYSGLPPRALQYIKTNLELNGFDVRVVFLMRDPVERCISAARMYAPKRFRQDGSAYPDETSYLRDHYRSEGFRNRTRYDITISNLEKVFPPEHIKYAFYEEMFTLQFIRGLTEFLGIPYSPADFSFNPYPKILNNEVPNELRLQVRDHYQVVYEFVGQKFGHDRIRKLWQNY